VQRKRKTLVEKVKDKAGIIAFDLLAVAVVSTALLAERAKEKVKKFVEEQKVDKIPVL